tara:strand:- start:2530 stop:2667 length:138 start_codon:yes stop_codon:yes gene_type:complete
MVSQRELEQVVDQINSSYAALIKRVVELENKQALTTDKKESKQKH